MKDSFQGVTAIARFSLIVISLCFVTGIAGEAKAQGKTIKIVLRDGTVMKGQPSMDYYADHLELGDGRQVERSKVSLLCTFNCKGEPRNGSENDMVVLKNGRRKLGNIAFIASSTDEWDSGRVEFSSGEEIFLSKIRYIKFSEKVFYNLQQAVEARRMATRLFLKTYELGNEDLSPDLWRLSNLKELDIRYREDVKELPKEIGNLRQLESLSIYEGNITAIPASISQLKKLRVLELNAALGPQVPKNITYLQNLEKLYLQKNDLEEIPLAIASLYKLRILVLDDNKLREIPAFISKLKNLRELSVKQNQIVKVAQSLATMRGLKISMGNNSLKMKDQEKLRRRFPNIVFDFDSDSYDDTANESPIR